MDPRPATAEPSAAKRPRSPSGDFPQIASKVPKTHSNHVQINYLARQYQENIPLVSADDTLPSILRLIGEYDGVLHRHESIAGNLGACPLGPILVKRFERLFDGPPKVLKHHGKEGHNNVTWLDVVEFAKNKPEQFNLEKTRNGLRVCQIYTKQCRVEISEEDYVLIASGMPQKMIPPQPIIEDEEKELGALEILEKNLTQIIQLADQGKSIFLCYLPIIRLVRTRLIVYFSFSFFPPPTVSARARQLNHRMKNRKAAIVSRRENDASLTSQQRSLSPWRDLNGNGLVISHSGNGQAPPLSPPSGFVAVNSRQEPHPEESFTTGSNWMFPNHSADNVTIINGTSIKGASPTTKLELMKKFFTTTDRQTRGLTEDDIPAATGRTHGRSRPRASDPSEYSTAFTSHGPVAIPSTPSSLLPQPKTTNHYERDDGGPYKIEMVSRMETLQRGQRILPPCDRCRRLHMDCLKNLTACMGCTKKHAKCSWKEVKLEELRDTEPRKDQTSNNSHGEATTEGETSNVETGPTRNATATPNPSAPHTRPASEPQHPARPSPPPRSISENTPLAHHPNNSSNSNNANTSSITNTNNNNNMYNTGNDNNMKRPGAPWGQRPQEADDADGGDPLTQAIMDTVDQHRARAAAASEREKSGEKLHMDAIENPEQPKQAV